MVVIVQLAGAIAVLLWGIHMVQDAIQRLLGSKLERYLRKLTKNRPLAFATGAASAFILQSSTAVILMVANFSNARLIGLFAALGVVIGAELGSSVASILLSLNIQAFALPLIILGYVLYKSGKTKVFDNTGKLLIGFGFILLGLFLIASVTFGLHTSDLFSIILSMLEDDKILSIFIMSILTWFIHSSLAAVLIIAQFAQDGTVEFKTALFLLLGANLGGAMPALVAGWAQGGLGRVIVASNLFFKSFIVFLGIILIYLIGDYLVIYFSGSFGVVAAHFTLNLIGGTILIFFVPVTSKLINNLVLRDVIKSKVLDNNAPIYLSYADISNPGRVLANSSNEALHMADIVYLMLNNSFDAFSDYRVINEVRVLDDKVDNLHRESLNYLVSASANKSMDKIEKHKIIRFITNLEHAGDIIDSSLMQIAQNKFNLNIQFDENKLKIIEKLHTELVDIFRLSQAVFNSNDYNLASELLDLKRKYKLKTLRVRDDHISDLTGHFSEDIYETQLFIDILRDFQRLSTHFANVSYAVIETID